MSDIENKTENTEETKTDETTSYAEEACESETKAGSSSSDIIIPAALLLVLAIVINTTYQKDGDKPVAQQDAPVITTTEIVTEASNSEDKVTQDQPALSIATPEETVAQTEVPEPETVAETEEVPTADDVFIKHADEAAVVATPQTATAHNNIRTQPAYAPYQYQPYNRAQAQSRAKQHMEMLQQRRQAYEKQMQQRQAQYEAAMKAQQEKRAKVSATQKAAFQNIQKDRQAAKQKIQEIHNQISKLHEEIHQIMQKSNNTATPQQTHSM